MISQDGGRLIVLLSSLQDFDIWSIKPDFEMSSHLKMPWRPVNVVGSGEGIILDKGDDVSGRG